MIPPHAQVKGMPFVWAGIPVALCLGIMGAIPFDVSILCAFLCLSLYVYITLGHMLHFNLAVSKAMMLILNHMKQSHMDKSKVPSSDTILEEITKELNDEYRGN